MKNTLTNSHVSTIPAKIAVAHGDGIGPEIMNATLRILEAAGASLDIHPIQVGQAVYQQGITSGIGPEAWEVVRDAKVLLKAPIMTPQGGGVKSLNVTLRKSLGLFANVRPCPTYAPFVPTQHPGMDVVIIRENEEDLYAGIEHRQTDEVYQCLKLMTRPGCERIARYAFEYARAHGRKKVTCITKDNIMKMTDGLFRRVFEEVGAEYPDIKQDHIIVDIGAARLATRPHDFDVILAPNLYGDILSDIAAEVSGSVGLAGSANIGEGLAMFEAVHGSAPDIAGKDIANPSGLLLSAVMMLVHVGQGDVAARIHNAWLRTLEDGIHTADVYSQGVSKQRVGTEAFAEAIIERLGLLPETLAPQTYSANAPRPNFMVRPTVPAKKERVGVDFFVHWTGSVEDLASRLIALSNDDLRLKLITNRGVLVWPNGLSETLLCDHWRCRFTMVHELSQTAIAEQLLRLSMGGIDVIKTENLFRFDDAIGYSLAQGE